jgi:epoxyqueuosine reductase QueG
MAVMKKPNLTGGECKLKEKLKEYCKTLGIEYVGIAPRGPYTELLETLEDRISKGYFTGFEEKSLEKRIDPRLTMGSTESVIVCLFPYFVGFSDDTNISNYTYAKDYHITIREKLKEVTREMSIPAMKPALWVLRKYMSLRGRLKKK